MLASRFPLVYLFHRYALAAAINVVGGAKVPPSLAGDGQQPVSLWPARSQNEAIQLLLNALNPAELETPAALWKALAPEENRGPDAERFASSSGYLFSPQDGARAVAEIVVGGLLDPRRVERLAVLSQEDPTQPSPSSVIAALVSAGFPGSAKTSGQKELQGVVQTEIAERLMVLAVNPVATPETQSAALAGVHQVQAAVKKNPARSSTLDRLEHEINLYLQSPSQNTPRLKPAGAPAGPPV